MVYQEFVRESAELAEVIVEKMDERIDLKNRGVRQALFYVLRRVAMPSVLVEVAFISNWREERLLNKSTFRQKVAEALCEALIAYRDRFEGSE
jgi:N-acetylmuramoyl-L-alanine amidase